MTVAHLAVDLRLGHQGRHRVDDHDVHGAAAHQHLDDLQSLLARVRLRDQQLVDAHADAPCVLRIQRVLRVYERGDSAAALRLGDDVQRQRGLAGRLRAVHLDHATARHAAHAERDVQGQRACRDHLHPLGLYLPQAHDRPLAVCALDLAERRLQRPFPLSGHRFTPLTRGGVAPPGCFDDGVHGTTVQYVCQRSTPT